MVVLRIKNVPDGSRIEINPVESFHYNEQKDLIMENASSTEEVVLFKVSPNYYYIKISGPGLCPIEWQSFNINENTILDAKFARDDGNLSEQLKFIFDKFPLTTLQTKEMKKELDIGKIKRRVKVPAGCDKVGEIITQSGIEA